LDIDVIEFGKGMTLEVFVFLLLWKGNLEHCTLFYSLVFFQDIAHGLGNWKQSFHKILTYIFNGFS
jgi:hypothetical protein